MSETDHGGAVTVTCRSQTVQPAVAADVALAFGGGALAEFFLPAVVRLSGEHQCHSPSGPSTARERREIRT
jgi:hypothetical protein